MVMLKISVSIYTSAMYPHVFELKNITGWDRTDRTFRFYRNDRVAHQIIVGSEHTVLVDETIVEEQ